MATQDNQDQPKFGPSAGLIAMFRDCSRDPTEAIKTRLTSMLQTFQQHHRDNAGHESTNDLASKCCCEAGIWYYRILERLASQERKRLGVSDMSVILENDLFQRCLVACCLEMTISTNRLPCDFPLLLQILKLGPYDFLRVIEPVLRDKADLPPTVFKHFTQVEAKVLESLAWTGDSPLWEEIRANEGHLPTYQQVTPSTQLEDPNRADSHPDRNQPGVDLSLGAEPAASTDDQQCSSSAANKSGTSNFLQPFARKVYSLMGKRLRELCSTLDICDELRLKIWTCFEHSLVHCTELMKDRHLDQLLMCAIYIMAMNMELDISFKHIQSRYESLPFASKSVCTTVQMSGLNNDNSPTANNDGDHGLRLPTPITPSTHYPRTCQEQRGNLVQFFIQVYTTKMQHFAQRFAPTSAGDTPPLSPFPQLKPLGRQRLPGTNPIFISPYNTHTASPMKDGLNYTINSSPSEYLRQINKMVKTGTSSSRRRLDVEVQGEGEEEEDGPPARRPRLDDSALHKRLESVMQDRQEGTRRDQDQPSPERRV